MWKIQSMSILGREVKLSNFFGQWLENIYFSFTDWAFNFLKLFSLLILC